MRINGPLLLFCLLGLGLPSPSRSEDGSENLDWIEFSGQLKQKGTFYETGKASQYHLADDRVDDPVDARPLGLYENEFRLGARIDVFSHLALEANGLFFLHGGGKRRADAKVAAALGSNPLDMESPRWDDADRFFNLQHDLWSNDRARLGVRLDKAVVSLHAGKVNLEAGRLAVSWGNGFLFNPLDMLSPFNGLAVDQEYKPGVDGISAAYRGDNYREEILFLPGGKAFSESPAIDFESSTLISRRSLSIREVEINGYLGVHDRDLLVGLGLVRNLWDAVARAEWLWSDGTGSGHSGSQFIVNLDYGGVFLNRNFYGWAEYFHNGHGRESRSFAAFLPTRKFSELAARGYLPPLGRHYLDAHVKMELHPLLEAGFFAMANARDGSGLFQPLAAWNFGPNLQLNLSASLFFGDRGTEFGGIPMEGSDHFLFFPDTLSSWLVYYF